MVRRSQAPARHPKRVPSAARSERPVETLARAAARDAWTAHGHQAPAYPSLPAWLALERMVAEAQLDGVTVGQGDRCSVLVDALLAKRDAWDELVSAARRVFLAAYRRELGALQVSTRPARVLASRGASPSRSRRSARAEGLAVYAVFDIIRPVSPHHKPLVLLGGDIKTPPLSDIARRRIGQLLRSPAW